jgi:hypothetical protein
MVDTIKFSEMTAGGDIANNNKVPGLLSGDNVLFNNPWTFLPPGTTAERPTPSSAINYRLRFNTDDQLYEYYDAVLSQWITLQESGFTVGPYITYTADASLPDAQNLGLLANGILKQTVSAGIATLNIAVNGTDYYGPGFTGSINAPSGITDLIGNAVVGFVYTPSSVNYLTLTNSATTFAPALAAVGTDTNISMNINTRGTGQILLNAANTTSPLVINSGTTYQHTTIFAFSNTSATRTVTFQDSSGTVAYLSDVAGDVTSAQGTASQVSVNGTTGIPQTGAITISLPQNIDVTSAVAFGSLTLVSPMLPASGGLGTSTAPTAGQIPIGTSGGVYTPAAIASGTNILVGNASGMITIGITGVISPANGGTGVNNGSSTLTLGGSHTLSGAFASTFTFTNTTSVTFPTSGTLATTSQIPSFPLSLANGGTAASLTASNGGIVYSNASTLAILAGTATATQMLQSGLSSSPAWSTTTWPATSTINQLLYSSAANTITGLATANSSVLITSAGGVPSFSTTLPSGLAATNMNLTTPTLGVATATSINFGGSTLSTYTANGTFTPVVTFATPGNLSVVYSVQTGFYSRIGNIVTAFISLSFTPTFTTASGSFQITGLPFTINASITPYGAVSIVGSGVPAGTTNNVIQGSPGSTSASIVAAGVAAQSLWTTTQFTTGVAAICNATLVYLV